MRYKCIIEYDGTNYYGYQRQPERVSIQEVFENALKIICKEDVKSFASGRTDAHVHAKGQVLHFDSDINMKPESWKKALNSLLPEDIHIKSIEGISDDFHARFSVKSKEYRYFINIGDYDVFFNNYTAYFKDLDIDKMKEAIKYFIGTHDFTTFSRFVEKKDTTRTITDAYIIEHGRFLEITFIGDGFLKYMVRIMVGTLIDIGLHKKKPEDINHLFEAKNRRLTGRTASPNGLYLWKVNY